MSYRKDDKNEYGLLPYMFNVIKRFIIYSWLSMWVTVGSGYLAHSVINKPYLYFTILLCVALLMAYFRNDLYIVNALRHKKYAAIAYVVLVIIWMRLLFVWLTNIKHESDYESFIIAEPVLAVVSAPFGLIVLLVKEIVYFFIPITFSSAHISAFLTWSLYFLIAICQLTLLIKWVRKTPKSRAD